MLRPPSLLLLSLKTIVISTGEDFFLNVLVLIKLSVFLYVLPVKP